MTDVETQTPLEDQLDEWLAGGEAEVFGPPGNLEQADRLGGALRYVERRIAEIDQAAADRIELIKRQQAEATASLLRREAELEALLEGWARAVHAEDPKRKTFALPFCGLIPKLRPRQPRLVVVGDAKSAAVVADVRLVLPDAVKETFEVQPGRVKEYGPEPGPEDITLWARAQGVDVPEGYEARRATVATPGGRRVDVPSVLMLVPGPEQAFSIQRPRGGS